ncbi:MAG: hypothetical protein AB7V13_01940 [Pseudorhodoplanes sp.]
MKIFWSWQSDHDGKISHYFVRDALNEAIEELKLTPDIEEPSEADRRAQLHLDHDTKDTPGWADIAEEIFDKIENSAVIIADVTPVASGPSRKDKKNKEIGLRPIMNPNVAIELGYTLRAKGWKNVIPLMNTAYGSVDRMPFDVDRTRRWAVTYKLVEGATNVEIKAERKKLASTFIAALKPFLKGEVEAASVPFPETDPVGRRAFFSSDGEVLAEYEGMRDGVAYYLSTSGPALYVRLIPTKKLGRILPEDVLLANVAKLSTVSRIHGQSFRTNDRGVISFIPSSSEGQIESLSQAFRNGEIWGVDTYVLGNARRYDPPGIPSGALEMTMRKAVHENARFFRDVTGETYCQVEVGLVGVKNWQLIIPKGQSLGKMYDDEVHVRKVVHVASPEAIDAFLLDAFNEVYRQTGHDRPVGLYEFPGPNAYKNFY